MITTELRRLSRSTRPAHSQLACLAIELFCPLSGGWERGGGGGGGRGAESVETTQVRRRLTSAERQVQQGGNCLRGSGTRRGTPLCAQVCPPLPLTGSESGAELDDCRSAVACSGLIRLPQFCPSLVRRL